MRLATKALTREKRRLFRMSCTLLVAGLLLFCSLLSLTALTVIVSWDTAYRLQALIAVMLMYLAGAVFAWRQFEILDREGEKALENTRQEFSKALEACGESMASQANAYPQSITMQLLTQQPGLVLFVLTELLPTMMHKIYQGRSKQRDNS